MWVGLELNVTSVIIIVRSCEFTFITIVLSLALLYDRVSLPLLRSCEFTFITIVWATEPTFIIRSCEFTLCYDRVSLPLFESESHIMLYISDQPTSQHSHSRRWRGADRETDIMSRRWAKLGGGSPEGGQWPVRSTYIWTYAENGRMDTARHRHHIHRIYAT